MTEHSEMVLDAILRADLRSFAQAAFNVLEGKPFRLGRHIDVICEAMRRAHEGACRRLVVNQPPRTLKSFLGIAFCAWKLGHEPGTKIIVACHDVRLAETHADKIRQLLRSEMFQRVFPDTVLRTDFSGRDQFQTKQGGQVLAISLGSGVTGHGADILLVDDPLDAGRANSASERQSVVDLFEGKLMSRLNSQANGIVLVLQQRLHEQDLSGHLLQRGGFEHVVVPLVAEESTRITIGDLAWDRPAGDILDPAEYPPAVITDLQRNPGMFAAQYQQAPRPDGEALVQASCFGVYEQQPPPTAHHVVISFDTAIKATGSSFSVGLVFKTDGRDHYLIDVWRDRVDYDVLQYKACELVARYKPGMVIIEDASLGTPLKGAIEAIVPNKVHLQKPRGAKIDRLQAVIDILTAGRVYLPQWASFKESFLREVCAFPGGDNDDQVDALSQYLAVMREIGAQWMTPKILASGPKPPQRHPHRDPANTHPNIVPRGRGLYRRW